MNDRTKAPPIHDPDLDRRVKDAGASKTVYALVTPETEAAKNFILGNALDGLRTACAGNLTERHRSSAGRASRIPEAPAGHIPRRGPLYGRAVRSAATARSVTVKSRGVPPVVAPITYGSPFGKQTLVRKFP